MKSAAEIREELKAACSREELAAFISAYKEDRRKGVRDMTARAEKKIKALDREMNRLEEMCRYEKEYGDYDIICGIDEVGRGPLAGPVVAGAVVLPRGARILYVNDSKKLSPGKREELSEIIMKEALTYGFGIVGPERIDEINILNATYEAMRQAVGNLSCRPDILLNDAVTIPGLSMRQVPIIKGDASSISIACASIIAKVYRDRMMEDYDREYPGYGFASNKGYGSAAHLEAIKSKGPCPIHRRTFIRSFV